MTSPTSCTISGVVDTHQPSIAIVVGKGSRLRIGARPSGSQSILDGREFTNTVVDVKVVVTVFVYDQ
jgi:hypothetical protein